MRRRELIKLLGGTAIAWPVVARAQQHNQKRRVAVLMGGLELGDAEGQAEAAAFEEGLRETGWKPRRRPKLEVDRKWLCD